VEFNNNYLLFRQPGTGIFFGADVGGATSFNSLNFSTAEGAPDNLVGLQSDHLQVLLPGEKTMEIWENVGGSGFPLCPRRQWVHELGCLNGRTMVKCDNSVFWVANDYTVRRFRWRDAHPH